MNSKTSSHRIRAVVKNDLKRFWVISLAAFVSLFIASGVMVITNMGDLDEIAGLIYSFNNMESFTYMWIAAVIPIASALCCFHYLHRVNEVSAYHSLPVTRKDLFLGHAIAGYLLSVVPVILNQLILLILARPVRTEITDPTGAVETVNGFARSGIIYTCLLMMLIMLFVYAISILAGMLTGTVLMHTVGAAGLNALAPCLLLFIWMYCKQFLKGYNSGLMDIAGNMTPVTGLMDISGNDNILIKAVVYLVIAVVILVLSYMLYLRRKVENATEPLAYGFMVPVTAGLLTFFFGTLMGYLISADHFIIGLAIGTVIMFIFSRMFVLKTNRIFNIKSLRSFIAYAVILAVFVSLLNFDVFGYEDKVPDSGSVKSVSTDILPYSAQGDAYDIDSEESGQAMVFKDKENIERITKIHKDLIASPDSGSDLLLDFEDYDNTYLEYTLDNGKTVRRLYDFDRTSQIDNDDLAALYESDEYKDNTSVYNSRDLQGDDPYKKISVSVSSDFGGETVSISGEKDRKDFIAMMEKDRRARTYRQEVGKSGLTSLGTISIIGKGDYEYSLLRSDSNTIGWLKEHGYYDAFDSSKLEIRSVSVARYTETSEADADLTEMFRGKTVDDFIAKCPEDAVSGDTYNVEISAFNTATKVDCSVYLSFDRNTVPDFIKKADYKTFEY